MVEVRSGGFAIEVCLYDVGPAGGSQDRYELTATRTNCLAYSPPLLHLVSTYLPKVSKYLSKCQTKHLPN